MSKLPADMPQEDIETKSLLTLILEKITELWAALRDLIVSSHVQTRQDVYQCGSNSTTAINTHTSAKIEEIKSQIILNGGEWKCCYSSGVNIEIPYSRKKVKKLFYVRGEDIVADFSALLSIPLGHSLLVSWNSNPGVIRYAKNIPQSLFYCSSLSLVNETNTSFTLMSYYGHDSSLLSSDFSIFYQI